MSVGHQHYWHAGKIPYETPQAAWKAAQSMQAQYYDEAFEAYRCPQCGRWFVGHAKAGKGRR